jgi:prepilin-type processing-associated H-X9-DG protein
MPISRPRRLRLSVCPHQTNRVQSRFDPRTNQGFTSPELLAVIGVIGLLAMMIIPATRVLMATANASKCASNLRQVSSAATAYAADHNGEWPPNQAGGAIFATSLIPYLGGVPGRNEANFMNSPLICPGARTDAPEGKYRFRGVYTPTSDPDAPEKGFFGLSYAQNTYVTGTAASTGVKNILSAERPSKMMTYLDMDGHYVASTGGLVVEDRKRWVLQRHGGRINVAFADGSVRPMQFDDIPLSNSPVKVFWSGRGIE